MIVNHGAAKEAERRFCFSLHRSAIDSVQSRVCCQDRRVPDVDAPPCRDERRTTRAGAASSASQDLTDPCGGKEPRDPLQSLPPITIPSIYAAFVSAPQQRLGQRPA